MCSTYNVSFLNSLPFIPVLGTHATHFFYCSKTEGACKRRVIWLVPDETHFCHDEGQIYRSVSSLSIIYSEKLVVYSSRVRFKSGAL
jgi:hypothetical protein